MSQKHNFKCPKCANRDQIEVVIECWAEVTDDGTDTSTPDDGNHTFDETSSAHCTACSFVGTVKDFTGGRDYWDEEESEAANAD